MRKQWLPRKIPAPSAALVDPWRQRCKSQGEAPRTWRANQCSWLACAHGYGDSAGQWPHGLIAIILLCSVALAKTAWKYWTSRAWRVVRCVACDARAMLQLPARQAGRGEERIDAPSPPRVQPWWPSYGIIASRASRRDAFPTCASLWMRYRRLRPRLARLLVGPTISTGSSPGIDRPYLWAVSTM